MPLYLSAKSLKKVADLKFAKLLNKDSSTSIFKEYVYFS